MKATNFYVYGYLRAVTSERGEAGTYYYIGKGRGNRAYSKHLSVPVPKDIDRIVIIADNLTEEEAFKVEMQLISKYGRINEETGILRNLTNGGEGISGYKFTDEQRARQSVGMNTPEAKAKHFAGRKKYFEDHPEWNARHSAAVKKHYENPENRAKISAAVKKRMEDPENRAKLSAATKKYFKDPEARERHSATMKKYYEDPENRARKLASHNTSEFKAKISATMKKYYENPENRAKHSALMNTPETNAKRSASVKKYFKDHPEARERHSATMKISHNTPEARAKISAAQKLAWIKRKEKALNESQEKCSRIIF